MHERAHKAGLCSVGLGHASGCRQGYGVLHKC
jgi:hypothetical protein